MKNKQKKEKTKTEPMFPKGMFINEVYEFFGNAILADNSKFNDHNRNTQDWIIISFFAQGGVISQGTAE